jgi:hypothetical protein
MTRRRNPPPRNPAGPLRSKKNTESVDNELRLARAARRADSQQKQRLRRGEWETEPDDVDVEPEPLEFGDDKETGAAADEDESAAG